MSEPLSELLNLMNGQMIEIRSRLDSIETYLSADAYRQGRDPEEVKSTLHTLQQTYHQKRLEDLEKLDPELAARSDVRTSLPELNEDILNLIRIFHPDKLDDGKV